jgi:hypothetical protein
VARNPSPYFFIPFNAVCGATYYDLEAYARWYPAPSCLQARRAVAERDNVIRCLQSQDTITSENREREQTREREHHAQMIRFLMLQTV